MVDMKKIFLGVLFSTAMGTAAFAEDSNWYAEGGFHYISEDEDGIDISIGALAGNIGYDFNNGFSVEAMLAQGIINDDIIVLSEDVSVGLGTTYGVAAKYGFDVGEKANLYAKLRFTSVEVEVEVLGLTVSESETKVGWGIGGTFDISEKGYLVGELNQFWEDSLGVFVGFGWRF